MKSLILENVYYWFAFHPHQKTYLEGTQTAYVAFGCGSEEVVLLIPLGQFASWLDQMHTTESKDRSYWHVNITRDGKNLTLYRKKGAQRIDLKQYQL